MKTTYILILIAILSFTMITCKKTENNFDKKVSAEILSCMQDEYSKWGYHDSTDVWHHVLSPFALDSTTNLPDTIFSSITGEIMIIQDDTVYVQVGDTMIKIEHRIAFGTAEVQYHTINNSPFQVDYYEITFIVVLDDNSCLEHTTNGAGIPPKTSFIEKTYIETDNKKIIKLIITNLNVK